MTVVPWTPEEEARLRTLAEDGWSSGAISRSLKKSRSAIVGKCWRQRITLKGRRGFVPLLKSDKTASYEPYIDPPRPAHCGSVKLDDLDENDCRYVHGEGIFKRFCGEPAVGHGVSYCQDCCEIMHAQSGEQSDVIDADDPAGRHRDVQGADRRAHVGGGAS